MAANSQINIKSAFDKSKAAANSDQKGARLESLVADLFGKVKGVEIVGRNVFNKARSREYDLVLENDVRTSGIYFLDPIIIVECKNTTKPTDCINVNWLIQKVKRSTYKTGILVSTNGITGDEVSNAHDEIIQARNCDGIRIIILTEAELSAMQNPAVELPKLLKRKLLQLCVFDKITFD